MYQTISTICLLVLCGKVLLRGPDRPRHARPAPPLRPRAHRRTDGAYATARCRPRAVARRERVSPYVPCPAETLDGDASALVRPYLVRCEQRQRRRALELALDGIDDPLDPVWPHGVPVGAAA